MAGAPFLLAVGGFIGPVQVEQGECGHSLPRTSIEIVGYQRNGQVIAGPAICAR
jgi:hypothetical protein